MELIPTLGPATSRMLADLVLVAHLGLVVFVVVGPVAVLVGNLAQWRWVNDPGWRSAHLAAIAIVVAESLFGVVCPLTTLETALRSQAGARAYAGGFVEHWVQPLLYHEAPAWAFTLAYCAFGSIVLATWWYFPPRSRRPGTNRVA